MSGASVIPSLVAAVDPGFGDYTADAQSAFRAILDAMARPGRISTLPAPQAAPDPMHPATAAAALALFDHETPVWLGDGMAVMRIYDYLRFHCSCPITKSGLSAAFAVVNTEYGVPALGQFDPGTDAFPDRSATLIVQTADLDDGRPVRLIGPGIETEAFLRVAGLPEYFWQERREQNELFPCGIDLLFTCGDRAVALPRSTEIEV